MNKKTALNNKNSMDESMDRNELKAASSDQTANNKESGNDESEHAYCASAVVGCTGAARDTSEEDAGDPETISKIFWVNVQNIKLQGQLGKVVDHNKICSMAEIINTHKENDDDETAVKIFVVRRHPLMEGFFILIGDEDRFRAVVQSGIEQVKVVTSEDCSKSEKLLSALNTVSDKNANPLEVAESLQILQKSSGDSVRELGRRFGRDKNWADSHLLLLKADPAIRKMVRERPKTLSHANHIRQVKDPQLQKRIANSVVKDRLTVARVKHLVKSISSIKEQLGHFEAKGLINRVFQENLSAEDIEIAIQEVRKNLQNQILDGQEEKLLIPEKH